MYGIYRERETKYTVILVTEQETLLNKSASTPQSDVQRTDDRKSIGIYSPCYNLDL